MVYSTRSRKFEDLDFNLVRDLWQRLLQNPYSGMSMERLVFDMKELGYGDNKVRSTVRVLARDDLILQTTTRKYISVKTGNPVHGRINVYQNSHVHEDFIEKFLSLCKSDKQQKGGTGKYE